MDWSPPPSHAGLYSFFRAEIEAERLSDWSRLARIPARGSRQRLAWFKTLGAAEREECLSCATWSACCANGFILGLDHVLPAAHPLFESWVTQGLSYYGPTVRGVKAPQLRRGVKAALAPLASQQAENRGGGDWVYPCRLGGAEFDVVIDYGSRMAQLRYGVRHREHESRRIRTDIVFESAIGFGLGWWDLITEDNLAESMALLSDCVQYCAELPARIRRGVLS